VSEALGYGSNAARDIGNGTRRTLNRTRPGTDSETVASWRLAELEPPDLREPVFGDKGMVNDVPRMPMAIPEQRGSSLSPRSLAADVAVVVVVGRSTAAVYCGAPVDKIKEPVS
jgi:hypothetical protein